MNPCPLETQAVSLVSLFFYAEFHQACPILQLEHCETSWILHYYFFLREILKPTPAIPVPRRKINDGSGTPTTLKA
jgi:hypothetical protein